MEQKDIVHSNKPIIILSIIAVLLVGIIAGLFYYQQKMININYNYAPIKTSKTSPKTSEHGMPEDTQLPKMREYKNIRYGYGFTYNASRFELLELFNSTKEKNINTATHLILSEISGGDTCFQSILIKVENITFKKRLELLDLEIDGDTNQVAVDGVLATQKIGDSTEHLSPCGARKQTVVIEHNNQVISIVAGEPGIELLDNILPTFKLFALSNQPDEPKINPVAVSTIVDCGTAGKISYESVTDSTGYTHPQNIADEDTKKAWECFTDHIAECTPAKIKSDTMGVTMEYQILEKKGDVCVISGPKLAETGFINITCDVTQDWIDFAFEIEEKNAPGEKFVKGMSAMSMIMAGGKVQYPDRTFTAECK